MWRTHTWMNFPLIWFDMWAAVGQTFWNYLHFALQIPLNHQASVSQGDPCLQCLFLLLFILQNSIQTAVILVPFKQKYSNITLLSKIPIWLPFLTWQVQFLGIALGKPLLPTDRASPLGTWTSYAFMSLALRTIGTSSGN